MAFFVIRITCYVCSNKISMIQLNEKSIAVRFMRYVQIDTQSDPLSDAQPTTEKQKDLSRVLLSELQQSGISAELDEYGYVYATIP